MLPRDCMTKDDLHDALAKLRPVVPDIADAFWLASLLDPSRNADVQAVAEAMAAELLGDNYAHRQILLEPPPEYAGGGDYQLGWATYAGKPTSVFGLREDELPQHVAILGRSGAGKSNTGYLLVWNLLRAGKPFAVLDWRRNYRHLARRPEGKDLLVLSPGSPESLSFNPLDSPPGLATAQREAYLRDMLSTMCTAYLPGFHLLSTRGVEYLLLSAVQELGTAEGEPTTFNDIRHQVEAYRTRSRESDWKASAMNILLKLTTGPIGRTFNAAAPLTFADVLDRPAILELHGLGSPADRTAFTQALLVWLFYHRLSETREPASFKHALIIEEAHHLFLRQHSEGHSVHDVMMRQMRDLGEAIVIMDQNPSLLSAPALGNTGVTICLNLKHADDVEAAAKTLSLPKEKWEYIARLPAGHAIVKVPDRFPTPFLVRFPLFSVRHGPASDEPEAAITDSPAAAPRRAPATSQQAIRPLRGPDRREKEEVRIGVQERGLLLDIAEHPLSVITERYKRLGWTAHTGTKVKRALAERQLVEQENLPVPEGKVSLLKLTGLGRELLAAQRVDAAFLPKNASLEHEYWKKRVGDDYRRRGYQVEEEVHIRGGRSVDLVAAKDGKKIAIEVETGKSDVQGNVRKCREAGFDEVIAVTTSGGLRE